MLVTTTNEIEGHRITQYLGLVRGITVRSRSVIGNIGAGIQSLFGGNISIYTDLAEKAHEHLVGPRRGADAKPLHRGEITASRRQIGAQDQEPRRPLRQRDDQLRALPSRKRQEHRVGAAGHEVDRAVTERVHRVQRR